MIKIHKFIHEFADKTKGIITVDLSGPTPTLSLDKSFSKDNKYETEYYRWTQEIISPEITKLLTEEQLQNVNNGNFNLFL